MAGVWFRAPPPEPDNNIPFTGRPGIRNGPERGATPATLSNLFRDALSANFPNPYRNPWWIALSAEFLQPYWLKLQNQLGEDYAALKQIFPKPEKIFKAFELTSLYGIKVVIIAQDPYPNDKAMGLAFSVPVGVPVPRSLQNIFAELERDRKIPFTVPNHGSLEKWALNGIFLLNTTLTVDEELLL